jgi:(S)-2-hydroxy-acid oxidase
VLRDVSEIKLHTTLLGAPVASPIAVAPSAMHRMAHPDGEEATARACASMRTAMILSTMSTTSMEDVAEASEEAQIDPLSLAAKMPSPQKTEPVRWYQLYVFKDREVTRQLVERAEAAGYKALVVTVDAPYLGRRRPDMRNEFKMPGYLRLANFEHADMRKRQLSTTKSNESALAIYFKEQIDPTLNWQDIAWLRTITNLPIIAKGIMTEEDAKDAVAAGVSGIIVSNHGGRQLDGAPATIEVLEEVVKAVGNRVEVYMDGGVRRGSDVFKALALGARAVFVGRPALWGLAYKVSI